jgi:hypothetical protein
VNRDSKPFDTRLAEAAPARHATLDGPGSPAAARLYERITAAPAVSSPSRARRRLPALAVAVAVGAAAAAIALGPGAVGGAPPAAAAAVLHRAALTASRQHGAVAAPGWYVHVKAIVAQPIRVTLEPGDGTGPGPARARLCVQVVQDWIAPDGSGRQVTSKPAAPSCGTGLQSAVFSRGHGGSSLVYPGATALPDRPAALERFIVTHFEDGHADSGATLQFAGSFLQSGARPRVRSALYRMIERLPGIQALGPMTDRLGRHGAGVGLTEQGVREVLIFDPRTSAVLEWDDLSTRPAGQVNDYTVYETEAVTRTAPGP